MENLINKNNDDKIMQDKQCSFLTTDFTLQLDENQTTINPPLNK